MSYHTPHQTLFQQFRALQRLARSSAWQMVIPVGSVLQHSGTGYYRHIGGSY